MAWGAIFFSFLPQGYCRTGQHSGTLKKEYSYHYGKHKFSIMGAITSTNYVMNTEVDKTSGIVSIQHEGRLQIGGGGNSVSQHSLKSSRRL